MKRYKLLKNLPYAKAGEIFELEAGIRRGFAEGVLTNEKYKDTKIWTKDIVPIKFSDWFEELPEIKLPERFFYIAGGEINYIDKDYYFWGKKSKKEYQKKIDACKSIGNYFETQEEAVRHFEYLRAKAIIKQDAKGVHFDWTGVSRVKYYGVWNCKPDILNEQLGLEYRKTITDRASIIYFNNKEDIEESFKKHPEEWKTYLTYEQ